MTTRRIEFTSLWFSLACLATACSDASSVTSSSVKGAQEPPAAITDAMPVATTPDASVGVAMPMRSSGPIPGDRICDALAHAVCDGARLCCSTFAAGDAALTDCVSKQTTKCQSDLMPLVSDSRAAYNPALGAAAVTQFATLAATCDPSLVDFASVRDGLLSMFAGTVARGAACPPHDVNDSPAIVSCVGGGICHVAGIGGAMLTGTCDAVRASARPCVVDLECDAHQALRCDFNSPVSGNVSSSGEQNLGLHGHCVARLADGASCARATECTSLVCQNKHCVARTTDRVYCAASAPQGA